MIKEAVLKDSIFRIGKVTSVEGRTIKIEVDKTKNSSHLLYDGEIIRNISVNSYVKITKGFDKIIGKVDGEFIVEDKLFLEKNYSSEKQKIKRILIVRLMGFFSVKGFERGIKELPLINNECFLLDKNEFEEVHKFVKHGDIPLILGSLTHEQGQSVQLGVNELFASHIGIFGNTGSGKSYTLAKIYNNLFSTFQNESKFKKNAKFLLFDFNGEYEGENSIFPQKKVYNLNTRNKRNKDRLVFNEADLLDKDLFSILANATEKTQKPFISRTIDFYKRVNDSDYPLDYFKNILRKRIKDIYKMADKHKASLLLDYIKEILPSKFDSNGIEIDLSEDVDFHNQASEFKLNGIFLRSNPDSIEETILYDHVNKYKFDSNFITKIIQFLYLQLIYDVFSNRANNEHVGPAINKLKSFQKDLEQVIEIKDETEPDFWDNNFFCVVNLDKTNTQLKKLIPLLVSFKLYAEHKKNNSSKKDKSLNIIIDEAHNILSYASDRESETWKDYRLETFEEIIKEGRKFGVFLTIASQRPSDISSTIISQLHNFFLHRLINNNDILAVEKTISYLDKVSFESLPILPTGTCIIAGQCLQVPVMVDISEMDKDFEPDNKTIELTKHWM
ncbi:ATP-binding protein [Pedobacter nototheniae]|uniref:ATP-binding protein n=1 Tax=Pedobacter nototheniae TaxID=2488994 RepID=UPI002930DCFE|nr:ATP-binding protein [Pedobacter nototheniae]